MTKNNSGLKGPQDLRKRAEESLTSEPGRPDDMCLEEANSLIHELRVHQIELEMQNEELLRVQHDLEVSRSRYLDLYDFAPVGYLTLNKQGQILELNLTAAKQLGIERGYLIKTNFQNFIFQSDKGVFLSHLEAIFDKRERQITEVRLSPKGGEKFYARLESIFMEGEDGAGLCRTNTSDVTLRKRAEAEAENQQLQKAESLERMAGAIAHYFNNQLGVVMGNVELALMDLSGDAVIRENLTGAIQAARRCSEISGLMLTYIGQSTGKSEPLDLSELCRQKLPILQAVIPKNVELDLNLPSPGPTVSANATQIQQVLTSLVNNAREACGKKLGAIHLVVKTISSADIPASLRFPISWQPDDNPYACLEVEDTGCGITDKEIEKIFDPFFSSKFIGRGLGLPVVLGIVKAHRGAVAVESEPGRGSVFRVFFPISAEAVLQQSPKAAQTPEMDEGGTVLLVDDEQGLRRMAAAMFTRLGFTVVEAEDGDEALEVFRQRKDEIRCVLCDLTMPRMDGWETLAALRALRPDIPVVLNSGYDEAQVMAGDHSDRPQAFLRKPYSMDELKAALGAAMGASSAESMKRD
jgi:two-component system, cell cycle sensor histidine kinase and response regulator CckA